VSVCACTDKEDAHLGLEKSHDVLKLHLAVDLDDRALTEVVHKCEMHRGERGKCEADAKDSSRTTRRQAVQTVSAAVFVSAVFISTLLTLAGRVSEQ
jgi:hypothetical protein